MLSSDTAIEGTEILNNQLISCVYEIILACRSICTDLCSTTMGPNLLCDVCAEKMKDCECASMRDLNVLDRLVCVP